MRLVRLLGQASLAVAWRPSLSTAPATHGVQLVSDSNAHGPCSLDLNTCSALAIDDESARQSVAIKLTLCELRSAAFSIPRECEAHHVNIKSCIEALGRSPQQWATYSVWSRDVAHSCSTHNRWRDLEHAKSLYQTASRDLAAVAQERAEFNEQARSRFSEMQELQSGLAKAASQLFGDLQQDLSLALTHRDNAYAAGLSASLQSSDARMAHFASIAAESHRHLSDNLSLLMNRAGTEMEQVIARIAQAHLASLDALDRQGQQLELSLGGILTSVAHVGQLFDTHLQSMTKLDALAGYTLAHLQTMQETSLQLRTSTEAQVEHIARVHTLLESVSVAASTWRAPAVIDTILQVFHLAVNLPALLTALAMVCACAWLASKLPIAGACRLIFRTARFLLRCIWRKKTSQETVKPIRPKGLRQATFFAPSSGPGSPVVMRRGRV
ncbi:uncharacterized protein L969DRAFT_103200 [Mixia osmundae IAM 14324]|uniref:Nuclear fusion protein KAR5 n=1 Tax=Mixia osmundae (strain CBS 9802 / IAM 14324 / JCM 22182 / KY 12970) TaxID=764103 RepID=G7DZR9_MIXOS|nr:uncharacterized protein L969DRAFT_103200 [Mixia osmundae IAM 14324]KEI39262.1 hypothetical protein L969DRAFT_103200 [Mixia osmundae IAM 14324]GAA96079.1 hypothetical protein E5Q_02740 [Mixia osmundae IAM 14324]